MGSQRGGCRPRIYNNVVSRNFSKMLLAQKPGKFSAFTFLSILKKKLPKYRVKRSKKYITTVPKTVHFLKVPMVPITVVKKYLVTVPRYCPTLRKAYGINSFFQSYQLLKRVMIEYFLKPNVKTMGRGSGVKTSPLTIGKN